MVAASFKVTMHPVRQNGENQALTDRVLARSVVAERFEIAVTIIQRALQFYGSSASRFFQKIHS
jgi:hypothetical protein